jgi:AAA domain
MLVWINGAYGAGKTSVARALASRLGEAPIIDPEEVGFMLRRIMPGGSKADFQDIPLWRSLTVDILAAADAAAGEVVIVPMTIANPDYFEQIIGGLRARGVEVRHFTLLASPRTLRWRLLTRLDRPAATRWCLAQGERCVGELGKPGYSVHLPTDRRRIGEIADDIIGRLA